MPNPVIAVSFQLFVRGPDTVHHVHPNIAYMSTYQPHKNVDDQLFNHI